ncbi:DNA cytosine methyltransferase [Psychrobacillus glaciei]|uniref:DNA cytosine methyltransferase n=1 Tax=Psychrobacillus glaciei TaxID=2283160 RepID=UPI00178C550E|nr:DNA cytosine methyltransferase [Psychrobacillus glaciei]
MLGLLDKLPFKTIYVNEIDDNIAAVFSQNFNINPDVRGVREVTNEELPEHDVLIGGFSCVSFLIVSQNPKRKGIKK